MTDDTPKKRRRKPAEAAAPPSVDLPIDTKAVELRDIAGRLRDLAKMQKRYAARKWQVVGAERDAMDAALKTVGTETEKLIARQVAIETGIEIEAPRQPPAVETHTWDPLEIAVPGEPEYPFGARFRGDQKLLSKRRREFDQCYAAKVNKIAAEAGVGPRHPVYFENLLVVRAEVLADIFWTAERFTEAEDRIKAIESQMAKATDVEARMADADQRTASTLTAIEQRLADEQERFNEADTSHKADLDALKSDISGNLQRIEAGAIEEQRRLAEFASATEARSNELQGRLVETAKLHGADTVALMQRIAELEAKTLELENRPSVDFDVQEETEDEGRFVLRRFFRNGELFKEIRHQTRSPIWRGVHDRNREYQPGDMCTWGGSVWHADKPSIGQIGGDKGWSLMVKKGRDAQ
ncbi:hypothetical protein DPM33_15120 [Mesorhizobium hawassense]|uniref:Uncharacterized protein n=1 Tax=Mesorhizobium hawassense TaxID=1209954 RepID=A0A330HZJ9_9HYPH|nr:hypothetical protein [Mesorhizobium hawassense]RAZ90157.1 hypothetical protein DPM33_15120 [Mesorhizobium hawassense]